MRADKPLAVAAAKRFDCLLAKPRLGSAGRLSAALRSAAVRLAAARLTAAFLLAATGLTAALLGFATAAGSGGASRFATTAFAAMVVAATIMIVAALLTAATRFAAALLGFATAARGGRCTGRGGRCVTTAFRRAAPLLAASGFAAASRFTAALHFAAVGRGTAAGLTTTAAQNAHGIGAGRTGQIHQAGSQHGGQNRTILHWRAPHFRKRSLMKLPIHRTAGPDHDFCLDFGGSWRTSSETASKKFADFKNRYRRPRLPAFTRPFQCR